MEITEFIELIPSLIPFITLVVICFVIPVVLTVINIINTFSKKKIKESAVDKIILLLGSALTSLVLGLISDYSYDESILIGGASASEYHQPFSEYNIGWLIIPFLLGIIGMLKLSSKKLRSPLATVIYMDFALIGMLIPIPYIIQLSKHFVDGVFLFPGDTIYLCLLPINYILCGIRLIKANISIYLEHMEKDCIIPKNKFMMKLYSATSNSKKLPAAIFGAMIIIIAIMFCILVLLGQGADGFVKLFTDTADWTFSQQIPPPPEQYEGHYLCTVASGGHEKIVKPQRIGYRQHTKIIVNRQLCIANAFEQLIEEKFPKTHSFIRRNYDKYGYPLSKHITTPLRADIVYILMKPLEWLFLIILYMFDINPEKRISMQYTEK